MNSKNLKKKNLSDCVLQQCKFDNVCSSQWLTGMGGQILFLLGMNMVTQLSIQILLNAVLSKM